MGRTVCTQPQCLYKGAFTLYSIFSQWWITAKNSAFLGVTTCNSVGLYRCFGRNWHLQFQVQVTCFFFSSFWWWLIYPQKKCAVQYINVQWIDIFFFFWRNSPPPQWPAASSFTRFLDHTQTHQSRQDSSGQVIRSWQRTPPDNTQHSQQTDIHDPGGIRTHNLSRRAAADPRFRPRGRWDRPNKWKLCYY